MNRAPPAQSDPTAQSALDGFAGTAAMRGAVERRRPATTATAQPGLQPAEQAVRRLPSEDRAAGEGKAPAVVPCADIRRAQLCSSRLEKPSLRPPGLPAPACWLRKESPDSALNRVLNCLPPC